MNEASGSSGSRAGQYAAGDLRLAAVFDTVNPVEGPGFAADHPTIDDIDQREAVAEYLDAGVAVLVTPMLMDDVVDRSRKDAVPMSFRSDGIWVWTDTVTYYLRVHGLAPEPDLLEHVLAQGDYRWDPDQDAVERIAAFVLSPPEPGNEPVWSAGGGPSEPQAGGPSD